MLEASKKGDDIVLNKGYVIIALAIVSVLLESLFYNNVTSAQIGKQPTDVNVVNLRAQLRPLYGKKRLEIAQKMQRAH